MAEFDINDLIKIRRHLHEIPELALHEKQTHAYLRQLVAKLPQDHLEIREPADLPTAMMVLVHVVSLNGRSVTVRILMRYPLPKKRAYHFLRIIQASCTHVGMISI